MRPLLLLLPFCLLGLLLGISSCHFADPDHAARGSDASSVQPVSSAVPYMEAAPPVEEILFEEPEPPLVVTPTRTKQLIVLEKTAPQRPRIAIIIDDMGYHRTLGDQLLELELDITFSFLPHAPHTLEQEEKAYQLGRDILVHLPMEAKDPAWDLGPGALYTRLDDEALAAATGELLDMVPHATGANNHMGSRFTEDARAMRKVLLVLQQKGFYFIDSYTSAASVGLAEATVMGLPTARRHVFLDNVHDPESVCEQLKRLVALAKKQGWAIGIGHPNQATLTALTDCAPLLDGVDVVAVHHLLQRQQP